MYYVIEDDKLMADCIKDAILSAKPKAEIQHFDNVISAIQSLDELPEIIFLDILLTGPDGFTLLNEIASYPDTAKIPIVIISSLNFAGQDLSAYNVVGILNKESMTPADIAEFVKGSYA